MDCASERTRAACSAQLSDSWWASEARSSNRRRSDKFAARLSSSPAGRLSPVWVAYRRDASETRETRSSTWWLSAYSLRRLNASDSIVWPRQRAEPSALIFTTLFQPPPMRASAASTAIWSFVSPAVSAIRS